MSNVVQFLEDLGRNPLPLSENGFADAVVSAQLEPAMQGAILNRDAETVNQLLGGRLAVMCMIVPAENDEPLRNDEQDGDAEVPDDQDSSRAA